MGTFEPLGPFEPREAPMPPKPQALPAPPEPQALPTLPEPSEVPVPPGPQALPTPVCQPRRVRDWLGNQASDSDASLPTKVWVLDGRQLSVDPGLSIEARIAAIAGTQRMHVARSQLLAIGISASAVDRRIRRGTLVRVHPGVYGLAGAGKAELGAEAAALLAAGPLAMLSHHSAAALWNLDTGRARPATVHVTVPGDRQRPGFAGAELHRSVILRGGDRRFRQGLPVTSPARTLLDLGVELEGRSLERLLEDALYVRALLRENELRRLLDRAGSHLGRRPLTAALTNILAGATRTESEAEEAMLALIRRAGLPEPETQARVLGYRIDFLWRTKKLAVEVDGYAFHRSHTAFERDRRRDAELLTKAGITTIRVPAMRVLADPYEVVVLLTRMVG